MGSALQEAMTRKQRKPKNGGKTHDSYNKPLLELYKKKNAIHQKVGRREEKKHPQRINTNTQKAYEKMFCITNQQGDADRNNHQILPHTGENDIHEKRTTTTSASRGLGEKLLSFTVSGDVRCSSLMEVNMVSKTNKINSNKHLNPVEEDLKINIH